MVATVSNPSRQGDPSGQSPTRPGKAGPGTDPGRVRSGPIPRTRAPLWPKRRWRGSVPGHGPTGPVVGTVPETGPGGTLLGRRDRSGSRSSPVERCLEIGRQRRFDRHPLPGERMDETEAGGVQELPGEPFVGRAVDAVAHHRKTDRGEVNADLVHASRLERY